MLPKTMTLTLSTTEERDHGEADVERRRGAVRPSVGSDDDVVDVGGAGAESGAGAEADRDREERPVRAARDRQHRRRGVGRGGGQARRSGREPRPEGRLRAGAAVRLLGLRHQGAESDRVAVQGCPRDRRGRLGPPRSAGHGADYVPAVRLDLELDEVHPPAGGGPHRVPFRTKRFRNHAHLARHTRRAQRLVPRRAGQQGQDERPRGHRQHVVHRHHRGGDGHRHVGQGGAAVHGLRHGH